MSTIPAWHGMEKKIYRFFFVFVFSLGLASTSDSERDVCLTGSDREIVMSAQAF